MEASELRGFVSIGKTNVGNTHVGDMSLGDLLHKRLGHLSWGSGKLAKRLRAEFGSRCGKDHTLAACEACMRAKAKQCISRASPTRPATRPLERVHFDLSPGLPVRGRGGVVGFLLVVDEFTDMWFVFPIKSKAEVPAIMQSFKQSAERHFQEVMGEVQWPVELASLRSDGEQVNVSEAMAQWCESHGIRHEISAPYCQWQDGRVERAIQTVWQGAEAMRKDADAPPSTWVDSLAAMVHTHNLLAVGDNELSPWERWHLTSIPLRRRIAHLRVWGSKCYALVPAARRRKLDDKVRVCVFLGYSDRSKAYVAMDLVTRQIIVTPHMVFDEAVMPWGVMRRGGTLQEQAFDFEEAMASCWAPPSTPGADDTPTAAGDGAGEAAAGGDSISSLPASQSPPDFPSSPVSLPSAEDAEAAVPYSSLDSLARPPGPTLGTHALCPVVDSDSGPDDGGAEQASLRSELSALRASVAVSTGSVRINGEVVVPRVRSGAGAMLGVGERLAAASLSGRELGRIRDRIHLIALAASAPPLLGAREPATLRQARANVNWPAWADAMDDEMGSMRDFGVWVLVPPPPGSTALGCKWVFKIKRDKDGFVQRLKARLTLKGYRQVEGRDYGDTWAPTGRMRAFRFLMAEASSDLGIGTAQWDCTSAFLHASMDREVYMQQPEGHVVPGQEGHVCKLLKAIYGTKQASKLFYDLVKRSILAVSGAHPDISAMQCRADDCLYVLRCGGSWLKILTHVDDFAVTFNDRGLYDRVFAYMSSIFKITDYGGAAISHYVGIAVRRRIDGAYELSQTGYIDEVLDRLGLANGAQAQSPEATGSGAKLRPLDSPLSPAEAAFMASVPYREAVGALWYIARGTRFDLFRACQEVARFVDNPGPVHWRAVLRAYAYLARTRTKPLVMKSSGLRSGSGRGGIDLRVSGNSDADWAGCPSTSKSHTGWIVRFGGSLVSWRAALQGSVSQSSCEAEYVAGAALGNELVWWRLLCEDMGYPPTGPYPLYCDNEAAKSLAEHAGRFEATKHIKLRYHVLRQYQAEGAVRVIWCPATHQWADVLTKNCAVKHFKRMVSHILGSEV